MADIRRTGQLDDFAWSVFPYENPISHGGAWANVDAVWNGLQGGVNDGEVSANNFSWSYWTAGPYSGDIEVWGYGSGGGLGAAGEGWRLGFWTDVGGNTQADGYALAWFGNPSGGFFMRSYLNTAFTNIGTNAGDDPGGPPGSNIVLFRRTVATTLLEGFWSGDNGANWVRVYHATNATYMGPMYIALCAEDPSNGGVGWTGFGGGVIGVTRTQFFRRPSN